MNNVLIVGQIEGDAKVAFTTSNGINKLYKFVIKVPRPYYQIDSERIVCDFVNVKCWSTKLEDEDNLHDQDYVGIEGRIQSFGGNNKDFKKYGNEVIATKITYLE